MKTARLGASVVGALVAFVGFQLLSPSDEDSAPPLGSGMMFDKIAPRYDFINRAMSLGMDMGWRHQLIDALEIGPLDHVLDLGTGTADVAILEARRGAARVLGVDPSPQMLAVGRRKVDDASLVEVVRLEEGDAQQLPDLANASFDKVSMSFAIRNVPDRSAVLREMRRVVRASPTSRVCILEFSEPEEGWLAPVARAFIKHAVPVIGAALSGKREEYLHLQRSIAAFPPPTQFAALMTESGLAVQHVALLNFGSVALYTAVPV